MKTISDGHIQAKTIIEWAKQGEHIAQEFKKKIAHPEKVVREVVAFANTHGGRLMIGVDDDGTVSGLKFPEEEEYLLHQAILKYCHPPILFKSHIIALTEKKSVVLFEIEESSKKPHYVIENFETQWGRAYVRVDDKSIQASKEMREIIKRKQKNKDIRFHYGEKEQVLMGYLAIHKSISVKTFAQTAKLPLFIASKTLVLLTLANVLEIIPDDGEDRFRRKD